MTLTRTLTNVGTARETYRSSVSGLPGMKVSVTPASVTLAPGKSATVTITVRRGSAPWDRFVTGSITWHGRTHTARIPVAARPWGSPPGRTVTTGRSSAGWPTAPSVWSSRASPGRSPVAAPVTRRCSGSRTRSRPASTAGVRPEGIRREEG
ncbi:hypothetical protein NKG94_11615 [Micromonospora sp. M12]